jgi:hypothetical protein
VGELEEVIEKLKSEGISQEDIKKALDVLIADNRTLLKNQ